MRDEKNGEWYDYNKEGKRWKNEKKPREGYQGQGTMAKVW